jgi:hypothetical protein
VPAYLSSASGDRDQDRDHNDDDEATLNWGHPASAADERQSASLIRRYFAAAANEDGALGCRLLVPFIAESVAEQDGHSPALRGRTCPTVLTKLFSHYHRLLAEKSASLKVVSVRVEGDKAMAVLDFRSIPVVRLMSERRIGRRWKLLPLLDGMIE